MKRFCLLITFIAFWTFAFGQYPTVTGNISNPQTGPVVNLPVIITNPSMGGSFITVYTDANGNYIWQDTVGFAGVNNPVIVIVHDCDSSVLAQIANFNLPSLSTIVNFTYCQTGGCTVNPTYSIIGGTTVQFSASVQGLGVFSYLWDFGDGNTSTQQNPVHTYASNTIQSPCLYVTNSNGCSITHCFQVFFTPNNCNADFTYVVDSINQGQVHFNSQPTGSGPFFYHWDFGDNNFSFDANPSHTYASAGSYLSCLTVGDINGCNATFCDSVTVSGGGSSCTAFINNVQHTANPLTFIISAQATGTAPFSYTWDFGDGTIITGGSTNTHTFNNYGVYNITVTVTDATGCVSVNTYTIYNINFNTPGSIKGNIFLDSTIFALPQAEVYLIAYDSIQGTLTAIDTVLTQQGIYIFNNVPQGAYLLKAALLPSDPLYSKYLPTYFGDEMMWTNAVYVNPVPASLPFLVSFDINLIAGNNTGGPGFIGGLISNGAGRPTIQTVRPSDIENMTPMPGISVLLLDDNGNAVTHTVSGADGKFQFDNLALGTYTVHVEEYGKTTVDVDVTLDGNTPSHNDINFTVYDNMVNITQVYAVKTIEALKVFPNPVQNEATLQVELKESMEMTMRLTNMMGVVVQERHLNLNAGEQRITLDMTNLPAGMYFISLKNGDAIATYKVQKQF